MSKMGQTSTPLPFLSITTPPLTKKKDHSFPKCQLLSALLRSPLYPTSLIFNLFLKKSREFRHLLAGRKVAIMRQLPSVRRSSRGAQFPQQRLARHLGNRPAVSLHGEVALVRRLPGRRVERPTGKRDRLDDIWWYLMIFEIWCYWIMRSKLM